MTFTAAPNGVDHTPPQIPSRRDLQWAAGTAALVLAVYVRTLAPGMIPIMDTPMFQFIGHVLGVAHNPGYPTYVLLTYPFSYLPVGSLAYRLNLFSAVLGAVTAGLGFMIARRLGCRPVISCAAALALAFGREYWSQAVIAEVYTLNTAIIGGMLLALLAWRDSHRDWLFFAAFALLALGLGNHTTIVGFVPGMVLFALLTDRRFALRPRTIGLVAAILAAGLCQYAFILIRSRRPDVYVEFNSRATTIGALIDVMRGREFRSGLFTSDWQTVLFQNVPWLMRTVLAPELTVPGILAAFGGAWWLLRRRLADGLLLLLGCGAIVGFTANYSAPDIHVFLIPAILVLWLCAAAGTEAAVRFLAVRRRPAAAMAGILALGAPSWLFAHNFAANDLSRQTEAHLYFDYLFSGLPDRSVLIRENWWVDRMVNYKLLGDGLAAGRQLQVVSQDNLDGLRDRLRAGARIFGFSNSTRLLGYHGFDFDPAPYAPAGEPLPQLLARIPGGAVVAIAVPAAHAERFAAQAGRLFESIGGSSDLAGRTQSNLAVVGVRGARGGALEGISDRGVTLNVLPPAGVGTTGAAVPVFIQARADGSDAAIRIGPRDVVHTTKGAALVVLDAEGRVQQVFVLPADRDFRVPAGMPSLSLHALRRVQAIQQVTSTNWIDIGQSAATGIFTVRVPPGATVVCYIGDAEPLVPRVVDQSSDAIDVEVTAIDGDARREPGIAIAHKNTYAIRLTAPAGGVEPISVQLALGGIPAQAAARVLLAGATAGGEVFGINTAGFLDRPDRAAEILEMYRDQQSQLFGEGWSVPETDAFGAYRRTTELRARVLMPIARDARTIRIQALSGTKAGETDRISLQINGSALPPQMLQVGWHPYEWSLAPGTLHAGTNDVTLVAPRGIAVANIAVGPAAP